MFQHLLQDFESVYRHFLDFQLKGLPFPTFMRKKSIYTYIDNFYEQPGS